MKHVMGIINLTEPEDQIQELTQHRPLAAVPIGGRYRLMDFILSNLVNAGITNVGILVQQKYRALMDHLGPGKEWDLARARDGLRLLPPALSNNGEPNKGDIANFAANMEYLEKSTQEYVVVAGSNMICNLDLESVVEYHMKKNADVTVVYKEGRHESDCDYCTYLTVDENKRVTDMAVNPHYRRGSHLALRMYVLRKDKLIDLVDSCHSHGALDFAKDAIAYGIKNQELAVYGYPFTGYLASIDGLRSYFKHSMELLHPTVWDELFFQTGLVYTKVKNEPPTKYMEAAEVHNALLANGCIIEGRVENSICFRGVHIGPGAVIRNSIIMQKSQIDADVHLDNVILDKEVHVSRGKRLAGEENYPVVIQKQTRI